MRQARALPRASTRGGFSLVEMIVAIVLLSVGLLALAGTTGAVTDLMVDGARQTEAGSIAQRRFETLQGTACTSIAGGSATTGVFGESWTVTNVGSTSKRVSLTVTYTQYGSSKSQTFNTVIRCK
jgi:prepilin-type N-terminal cleavage/methylation domain-containing protein